MTKPIRMMIVLSVCRLCIRSGDIERERMQAQWHVDQAEAGRVTQYGSAHLGHETLVAFRRSFVVFAEVW